MIEDVERGNEIESMVIVGWRALSETGLESVSTGFDD
jgi:hypothetical protein